MQRRILEVVASNLRPRWHLQQQIQEGLVREEDRRTAAHLRDDLLAQPRDHPPPALPASHSPNTTARGVLRLKVRHAWARSKTRTKSSRLSQKTPDSSSAPAAPACSLLRRRSQYPPLPTPHLRRMVSWPLQPSALPPCSCPPSRRPGTRSPPTELHSPPWTPCPPPSPRPPAASAAWPARLHAPADGAAVIARRRCEYMGRGLDMTRPLVGRRRATALASRHAACRPGFARHRRAACALVAGPLWRVVGRVGQAGVRARPAATRGPWDGRGRRRDLVRPPFL